MRTRVIRAGWQVAAGGLLLTLGLTGTGLTGTGLAAPTGPGAKTPPVFVYVTNPSSNKVLVISAATNKVVKTIKLGQRPTGLAITPNDKTLYITILRHQVVPINAVTNRYEGAPIDLGGVNNFLDAIAVTPDSKMAYVVGGGVQGAVTPIVTATNQALNPIPVGGHPRTIAITPDGRMAYVSDTDNGTITPIVIATNQALSPITVGPNAGPIVFTPNSQLGYVTIADGKVVPFSTSTNEAGPQLPRGSGSSGIAFTPDSKRAYLRYRNSESHRLAVISTATGKLVKTITFGPSISDATRIVLSPNAKTVYVAGFDELERAFVYPISVATGKVGKKINLQAPVTSIVFTPNGQTAYLLMEQSQVGRFSTATGKVSPPIPAGSDAGSMVITP
jgi:YVTN family beta-propeller protein